MRYFKDDFDVMFNTAVSAMADTMLGGTPFTPNPTFKKDETLQSGKLYRKVENDRVIYRMVIAGVDKDNINLTILNDNIIVDVRKSNGDGEKDTVLYMRELTIDSQYDLDKAVSCYVNGVLDVEVPLKKKNKSKTIRVQ